MGVGRRRPVERVLEVQVSWGTTILETQSFLSLARLTMGDGAALPKELGDRETCHLQLPSRGLPDRYFPLVLVEEGQDWPEVVLHKSFAGRWAHPGGRVETLHQITGRLGRTGPLPETWRLPLLPGETAIIEHGELTLSLKLSGRVHLAPAPWVERIGTAWVNALAGALAVHAAFLLALAATPTTSFDVEPGRHRAMAPEVREARPSRAQKPNDPWAKLHAPVPGIEGKSGTPRKPDRTARASARPKAGVETQLFAGLLGPLSRDNGPLFGATGVTDELATALGRLVSARVADASGHAGQGLEGTGARGGGESPKTVDIGKLRPSAGSGDDPSWRPEPRPRRHPAPKSEATALEALDRETVGWVVDNHKVQLRFCYELALLRTRTLTGRIALTWVITENGSVRDVLIESSTLGASLLHDCILEKVRSWRFPEPMGGGEVVVHHPFLLRPADARASED